MFSYCLLFANASVVSVSTILRTFNTILVKCSLCVLFMHVRREIICSRDRLPTILSYGTSTSKQCKVIQQFCTVEQRVGNGLGPGLAIPKYSNIQARENSEDQDPEMFFHYLPLNQKFLDTSTVGLLICTQCRIRTVKVMDVYLLNHNTVLWIEIYSKGYPVALKGAGNLQTRRWIYRLNKFILSQL